MRRCAHIIILVAFGINLLQFHFLIVVGVEGGTEGLLVGCFLLVVLQFRAALLAGVETLAALVVPGEGRDGLEVLLLHDWLRFLLVADELEAVLLDGLPADHVIPVVLPLLLVLPLVAAVDDLRLAGD